jgi:hypothetical protein
MMEHRAWDLGRNEPMSGRLPDGDEDTLDVSDPFHRAVGYALYATISVLSLIVIVMASVGRLQVLELSLGVATFFASLVLMSRIRQFHRRASGSEGLEALDSSPQDGSTSGR